MATILVINEDRALLKESLDLGSLGIIGKPFDLERIGLAVAVCLILANAGQQRIDVRRVHP